MLVVSERPKRKRRGRVVERASILREDTDREGSEVRG